MGKDKPICFISGAMTGVYDYIDRFLEAEVQLKALGFIPFNPAAMTKPLVDAGVEFTEEQWLSIDFAALKNCAFIYHLTNWEGSSGAKKEHDVANAYGIPVLYQKDYSTYLNRYLDGGSNEFLYDVGKANLE